jgi:hypothetical protein
MSRITFLFFICLFSITHLTHADTGPAPLETSKQFDKRTVYFNVFPSTDLRADMAASYQIVQAKDRVVVNISLRDASSGNDMPQAAVVTGTYTDLMTNKKLEFKELRESSGISYIAQLQVTNRELLRFDVDVAPISATPSSGVSVPLKVSFTRRFAVDD